jgi:hypothetical protein
MLQMLSYDVTFNPPPLYRLDDYGAPPAAPLAVQGAVAFE